MMRPTKYDDDGERAPQTIERDVSGGGILWVVAVVLMLGALTAGVLVQSNRIKALEHRIDYDRKREVERFNHASDMRASNLKLISRQTEIFGRFLRLDDVNRDHHRACQRAAVEFLPEEE